MLSLWFPFQELLLSWIKYLLYMILLKSGIYLPRFHLNIFYWLFAALQVNIYMASSHASFLSRVSSFALYNYRPRLKIRRNRGVWLVVRADVVSVILFLILCFVLSPYDDIDWNIWSWLASSFVDAYMSLIIFFFFFFFFSCGIMFCRTTILFLVYQEMQANLK